MATKCHACPLRRKEIFTPMSEEEVAFMQKFKTGELNVNPGTTLLMEGSNSPQLFTVLEGMGLRYKTLADGRRQVLNFALPGDFAGLQAGVMGKMQHSMEATTRMTLCVFDRASLWSLFRQRPQRAFDLTWLAAIEEHFLGDSVAALGQMTAREKVARAFVHVYSRARAVDMARNGHAPLPYTQQDLADALGLSLVHTNKTLKTLRERQIATWREGRLAVNDFDRLCEIAQVAPDETPQKRPLI